MTVDPGDLTVDGMPADGYELSNGDQTITFTFNSDPFTDEGEHTIAVADGAFERQIDGSAVRPFSASFRYDVLRLGVTDTDPDDGSAVELPLTSIVLHTNEPIDPSSAGTNDITLNQGSVEDFNVLPGDEAVEYLLSGITAEGTLTVSLAAGALTDVHGNPGLAYSGSFILDIGTVPYPTPLVAKPPLGSLIYDPTTSSIIGFAGDTDRFTINLDEGQRVTVVVDPGIPALTLYGGVGNAGLNPGALLIVNQTTAAGTLVADPTTPGGLTGLAFDPVSGLFFGSTIRVSGSTSLLVRLDPDTGALLSTVGPITEGVGGPAISIGDLAIQPGTNTLFGIRSNAGGGNGGRLYTIDKATGVATFVGNTGSGVGGGLAFGPDGTLYQITSALRRLNPATGAVISSVSVPFYFDGLVVRPTDGVLFAARGGPNDAIYTINPATGAATFVGGTGAGSTSDLEFRPPSTLAPSIEVRDPSNVVLGGVSGPAGANVLLQTIATTTAGTYTVSVTGASGTTGRFGLQLVLNAALESESQDGPSNKSLLTAQDLGGSFIDLGSGAARGAVLGRTDPGAQPDFYAFHLDAGQSATLAVTGSGVGLELQNSLGTPLALSSAAGNVNAVIDSFVATASATYFARVSGNPGVNYSLLVTRNADFDTESNNTLATAQDFSGVATALGAVTTSNRSVTVPANRETVAGGNGNAYPFSLGFFGVPSQRYQQIYTASAFTSGGTINQLRFRRDASSAPFSTTGIDVQISLGYAARNTSTVSTVYAENIGAGYVTVFDGLLSLSSSGVGNPNPFDIVINVSPLFTYDPTQGDLLLDVRMRNSPRTAYFDLVAFDPSVVRIWNTDVNSPVGNRDFTFAGLVTQFGMRAQETDTYQVSVQAGDHLVIDTRTPGGDPQSPFEFHNLLDPAVQLFDPAGAPVGSDDNSGPDGKNAALSYAALSTGTYRVQVFGVDDSVGEYVLSVGGATGALPSFRVAATTPVDGSRLRGPITQMTVDFNDSLLLTSLAASDLTVNGVPATGMTLLDYNTVRFTLPVLGEGTQDVAIAAGAIEDIQGTALDAFAIQFYHDITPPRVVSSSVQQGAVLPAGALTYTVQFSEPMKTANLDASDFSLYGELLGTSYQPISFTYDATGTILTLNYTNLPEDRYTLQLYSGAGRFEDVLGWDLDGEPHFPTPPNASGDGVEGGDFYVGFELDVGTAAYPVPLTAVQPAGSLVYQGSQRGLISTGTDKDKFTLSVDRGQKITVVVSPSGDDLKPSVQIDRLESSGPILLGSVGAGAPGADAVIQTVSSDGQANPPGPKTFLITVYGTGQTTGEYFLLVYLNAAVESESHDGATNGSQATAQSLEPSAVNLNGPAQRLAVLGTADAIVGQYASYVIAFSSEYSDTDWSAAQALGEPDTFEYGDISTAWAPVGQNGTQEFLTVGFDRPARAAGVAIRETLGNGFVTRVDLLDGQGNLNTVWTGTDPSQPGTPADLVVRFPLTNFDVKGVKIYVDTSHNLDTWEEIDAVALLEVPPDDYYTFDLKSGDSVTLGLAGLGGNVDLALQDASGQVLALGSTGARNVDEVISNFVATKAGKYYAVVSGAAGAAYNLFLTRNADFDTEINNELESAQPVVGSVVGGQRWVLGSLRGGGGSGGVVGYYTDFNPFSTGPEAPILQAGLTPVQIIDITTFDLNSVDILMVDEFENGGLSFELSSRLPDIEAWVADGGSFVVHDRFVGFGSNPFLLGAPGAEAVRDDFAACADLDVIPPGDTLVTNGPHGTIDNTNLDGGTCSNHGFVRGETLPAGAVRILSAGPDSSHVAALSYELGSGFVYYASIPLDAYLDGYGGPPGLLQNMVTIYAPNVLAYTVDQQGPTADFYQVTLAAGQTLELATSTPADASGEFVNLLDTMIRVYNAAGQVVASDDNSGTDGRNAKLSYRVPAGAGGTYYIEVLVSDATAEPTAGEYVLAIKGATAPSVPFAVTDTSLPDGTVLFTPPAQITVDVSDTIMLPTLQAADLRIDGTGAHGLLTVDGDTAVFDIPSAYQHNGHYYIRTAGAMSWAAAEAQAVSLGGHLVSIGDQAEQNFLKRVFASNADRFTFFWIGLNDVTEEGAFVWTSGEPVTYTNWAPGEPNDCCGGDPGEDAAVFNWDAYLNNGAWNDAFADDAIVGIIELTSLPAGWWVATEGTHTVSVAAGSIRDVQNTPIAAYSSTFQIDLTPPVVVATSVADGDLVPDSNLTIDITLSEPLRVENIDAGDVWIQGQFRGNFFYADSVSFDPTGTVLTVSFSGPYPDDLYRLELASGDFAFEDLIGLDLDGDGDGVEGPNFTLNLAVDGGEQALAVPLVAVEPVGSLIYRSPVPNDATLTYAADTDDFTIDLDRGQVLSVLVSNEFGLIPTIEVINPAGDVVGSSIGSVLQTASVATGGTYTVRVGYASGPFALYQVEVVLNAALEGESQGGAANDSLPGAQEIDGSFTGLLNGATRGAVLGDGSDFGGRYVGAAVPFEFEDIRATGTPTLQGADDDVVFLSAADLNGFQFNFYNTPYDSLFFNSNGLITFGAGNASYSNTDLAFDPFEAAIAAYWNDLFIVGSDATAVLWEVRGSGDDQRLIVQWNEVTFCCEVRDSLMTFQAVLSEADGSIQFNYLDLQAGFPGQDDGASATVGVKNVNLEGEAQRTLLAFYNGPNQFVGTGQSTRLVFLPPGPDLYSFDIAEGQRVTLAVKALTDAAVHVALLDPNGVELALGSTGPSNVDEVVYNVGPLAAGRYYARVTGDVGVEYSLVVTRDAVFDAEGNDSMATAQPLGGTHVALGHVAGAPALGPSITTETEPNSDSVYNGRYVMTPADAATANDISGDFSPVGGSFESQLSGYRASLDEDFFRFYALPGQNAVIGTESFNGSSWDTWLELYDSNFILVAVDDDSGPGAFSLIYYTFPTEIADNSPYYIKVIGYSDSGSGEYLLRTTINYTVSSDSDFYSFEAAAGETIDLFTATPGGGPGEPVNGLNPHLRLFGPDGAEIAFVPLVLDVQGNERILYTVPEDGGGTYIVEVSAEDGTRGEYILDPVSTQAPALPAAVGAARADGNRANKTLAFQESLPGGILLGSTQTRAGIEPEKATWEFEEPLSPTWTWEVADRTGRVEPDWSVSDRSMAIAAVDRAFAELASDLVPDSVATSF